MQHVIQQGDIDNWYGCGRGRRLDFYATDDELQEWLLRHLPAEYEPYRLLAVIPRQQSRRVWIWSTSQWDISELRQVVDDGWGAGFINLWIWSMSLTPGLPIGISDRYGRLDDLCGMNGLVNLQRLTRGDGAREPLSMSILPTFVNVRTRRRLQHKEYLQIFEKLRKAIKRQLVYSSIHVFPDGRQLEDSRCPRMTEAAVRAYRSGARLANLPGRYVGPRR